MAADGLGNGAERRWKLASYGVAGMMNKENYLSRKGRWMVSGDSVVPSGHEFILQSTRHDVSG
jgi:hypothetical protein